MALDDDDLRALLDELTSRIEAVEAADEIDEELAELLRQYRRDVARILVLLESNTQI